MLNRGNRGSNMNPSGLQSYPHSIITKFSLSTPAYSSCCALSLYSLLLTLPWWYPRFGERRQKCQSAPSPPPYMPVVRSPKSVITSRFRVWNQCFIVSQHNICSFVARWSPWSKVWVIGYWDPRWCILSLEPHRMTGRYLLSSIMVKPDAEMMSTMNVRGISL